MTLIETNKPLRSRPLGEFPTVFAQALERLAHQVTQATSGFCRAKTLSGSYSYKLKSRVACKLLPQHPEEPVLYVGFAEWIPTAEDYCRRLTSNPSRQSSGGGNDQQFVWSVEKEFHGRTDLICHVMKDFLVEAAEKSSEGTDWSTDEVELIVADYFDMLHREQYVLEVEKKRLIGHGRKDLARRVEWVSETQGDGAGFDVLSFDEVDGAELYIEVKTTTLGKFFPFYVTANEIACSESHPEKYRLYRVFGFPEKRRIYILMGALSESCRLVPTQYKAIF